MTIAANPELEPEVRIKAAMNVVDLIKERVSTQEKLQKLNETYGKLPDSHAALAHFNANSTDSLNRLISLVESASSLKTTYENTTVEARQQQVSSRAEHADSAEAADEVNKRIRNLDAGIEELITKAMSDWKANAKVQSKKMQAANKRIQDTIREVQHKQNRTAQVTKALGLIDDVIDIAADLL